MEKCLSGRQIVLGASRKTEEMTMLIEKQGGTASVRSLQGTTFKAEEGVLDKLQHFISEGADWVIFTTGVGIQALLDLAEGLGAKEEFIMKVKQAKVASRGYKSAAALKKLQIETVASDDDGTTQGLIRQLTDSDFVNQKVMVQLHGEQAPALMKFLQDKGAIVSQLLPYQHIPPVPETVATLCRELVKGEVDAVCFTTAIQVRSLFNYARETGQEKEIKAVFHGKTVAAAVGKVTAEALCEEGIGRIVVPEHERMGAMIVELARYFVIHKG
nr:uroporphyrinogen-III synthase [uncultured Bacillus sp.]